MLNYKIHKNIASKKFHKIYIRVVVKTGDDVGAAVVDVVSCGVVDVENPGVVVVIPVDVVGTAVVDVVFRGVVVDVE